MRVITISGQDAGQRMDRYLAKYMELAPKSFFYKMLRKKNIKLNGKKAEGNEKLQAGDEITLYLADETVDKFRGKVAAEDTKPLPKVSLPVIYEDEDILVINKPIGMLSQKANKDDVSLIEYITQYLLDNKSISKENLQTFHPGVCNRLDRNTSGLIVAGKSVQGLQWMNELFRERDLKKYYLTIVKGKLEKASKISGYLTKNQNHNTVTISQNMTEGASPIATEYKPLKVGKLDGREYTLLKVHLITGKSHQIRAHLQSIGHPVVGDGKYGHKDVYQIFKKEFGLRHQLLHAWHLEFGSPDYLPEKYHNMVLEAPLSPVFEKVKKGLNM